MSQERFAADAGVDRAYLGGLERQAENPTVDLLDRVAKALAVPLGELYFFRTSLVSEAEIEAKYLILLARPTGIEPVFSP